MSKKIIGVTVGTTLPKPNFKQTDPTKGDYIRNKPDFDGLKEQVSDISMLVGDTSVAEQIESAIGELELNVGASHNHDDVYYTESEIDAKLSSVAYIDENDNEDEEVEIGSAMNKPTEMDALLLIAEVGLVSQPAFVDANNNVYLDGSNNILTL